MDQRERDALDRHITGNYGEDQLREESGMCIWDDCGNDAIYCEGHAREYMQPDLDALKALNAELVTALKDAELFLRVGLTYAPDTFVSDQNRATGEWLKTRGLATTMLRVADAARDALAKVSAKP